ncbi:hypothetical protein FHETE_1244 [Fusarium heterosporum]|uniref:Uncharacterized protein n=1 Tax=Fusarium heterosporum TaxID=42747 RepID=A0A8H5TZA6_FUSHE|nr:hypothetical protein FHETE_1244 [Fusarium heterosporum]
MSTTKLKVPGYGLPLNYQFAETPFPIVLKESYLYSFRLWKANTLTVREVCMLKVMEELTNKPEWWLKIEDPDIVAKWMKEAMEMSWAEYRPHGDFTQNMADADKSIFADSEFRQCIMELRKKAEMYQKTGLVPVMDYTTAAIKSDTLIPHELRDALKAAVAPLENVPENLKDWHPGSDGKVLDIVHPSLWPLVYGRSRILTDKRINVEEALRYTGTTVTLPSNPSTDFEGPRTQEDYDKHMFSVGAFSKRFQWLPCDIDLTGEHPRIDSYINNLHPVKQAKLYPIIEKFIQKSLPAWDVILRWHQEFDVQRIYTEDAFYVCRVPEICEPLEYCGEQNRPVDEDEASRQEDEDMDNDYEDSVRYQRDLEWYRLTHTPDRPDPKTEVEDYIKLRPSDVKSSGFFNNAPRVQVIVKLANIHLTPEKPSYDGGSWHIEGQLNEHICATALYYYDCENITDSHLDFRTNANGEELMDFLHYEQGDSNSIEHIFAIDADNNTMQDIGSVLTRQDRMLFFPNVYQHHVSPFELADKSQPGHRKILALFLVDPSQPVISTANVPPQQRHWWAEDVLNDTGGLGSLPPEVANMVIDNLDFPIGLDDAKKIREELMKERSVLQDKLATEVRSYQFNFCEH